MATRKKRRRRTADEARTEILDVAEEMVRELGPNALRVQEVAARVGMSHPTLLHHVGSKEELLAAVASRGLDRLARDVLAAFAAQDGDLSVIDRVARAVAMLDGRGHPRLLAWLSLADRVPESRPSFVPLVEAAHATRPDRVAGREVPREDSQYLVVLVGLALLGDTVTGSVMYEDAGFEDVEAARRGFRTWLIRLVTEHIGA